MGEYLCNPLAEDVVDAEISVGGFFSDDELGVIEASDNKAKPKIDVPAGEARRFTISTQDEYDEMVCSWTVRYRTKSAGVVTAGFGTFKRLEDTVHFDDVPILGGPARVVPRSE